MIEKDQDINDEVKFDLISSLEILLFYHIHFVDYVCVTGSSAILWFAPGFTYLPLHHVCDLVCNDQQPE